MNIKEKINVLFVLPNFDTGGSEKLVVDLAGHLDRKQFAPVVCVFFSGVYGQKMKELGIPFYVVHEGGRIKSKLEIVKFLNAIVRKHKINVVNTHHTMALLQGLLSFKLFNRTRLIHTEHSRLNNFSNITPRILAIQRLFMKFIDAALGVSQGVCDYIRDELGVPEKKIIKILNGVDIAEFSFTEDEANRKRAEYRRDLKISNDEIVIGLFANLRKEKNHALLVKAIKILKDRGMDNIRLVFAGDGAERQNIDRLIDDMGLASCVRSLGVRHDIPELMNMIDIYCLPSLFEGLPFSLIEAMAAGLPCVATNVEGNREIVRNLQNGMLVESNNPEELANALQNLSADKALREALGSRAALDVRELSFENMIKKYEELFLKCGQ
jgi:glycosyltransferase involved in cell wall biosynthesis